MTKEDHEVVRSNAIERHAQTLLVLILVALLVWVGGTTQGTAIAVAQMQVQITQLQVDVRKPDGKFNEIERRLDSIERQLQDIKSVQENTAK